MKTILINEKFNFQFIASLRDYEADLTLLVKLGFKPKYEDVTKENSLSFASGRPEVLFTLEVKNVEEAAFIKKALHYQSRN